MTNRKEYRKKYYEEHKEKINEKCKKYYKEHKEEINERHKKYNEKHKEQRKEALKKYYEKHKEEIKEKNKKHKEKRNKYRSEYYKKNPEKFKKFKKNEVNENTASRAKATNYKQEWTYEDYLKLERYLNENKKAKEIAELMNRTIFAIRDKIYLLKKEGNPYIKK
jgi:hypothetical protein